MYAAGKIPGGFIKREGRQSEAATLAARLTDRPIRPLFPEGYKDDVQIVITVLSTDQENDPDILGTIAASAALTISEIPFQGPVGAVRVGRIDGEFVLNPTYTELADSELDLVVSGTRDAIMMVEAGVKILPEDVMAEAILFAQRSLLPLVEIQDKLRELVGKAKRVPYLEPLTDSVLKFVDLAKAGGEFVVVDVETTGTDPKMADLLEVAAVRVKGGKITDRWSTLVNPGRADRRQPDARHHRQGRQGRPDPGRGRPQGARVRRRRAVRRPLRRLRHRVHRGGPRRRHPHRARARTSTRSSSPARATRTSRTTSSGPWPSSSAIELTAEPPRAAGRRGHREPADLVRQRPARPDRRPQGRHRRRRSAPPAPTRTSRPACSRPPAATRASARACSASSRRRPSASSSSARASAWTAAPPTRSARSRSRSASCRARTAPACSPAARPRR